MRAFGTIVAMVAALIWSGVVWGGYWLVSVAAEALAQGAQRDWLPPEVWSISDMAANVLDDYGAGLAAGIWAIGILAILAVRAVYNWILTQAAGPTTAPPTPARPATDASPPARASAEIEAAPETRVRWGRNGA